MNAQEIGEFIKKRRLEKKISAAAAAGMMNKASSHILNIENKTTQTKLESLIDYLNFLGLHIEIKQTM